MKSARRAKVIGGDPIVARCEATPRANSRRNRSALRACIKLQTLAVTTGLRTVAYMVPQIRARLVNWLTAPLNTAGSLVA